MRTGPVKLLWGVAFVIGASAELRAQDVVPVMDNRQACQILSSAVPAIYAYSSNTDSDVELHARDVNRAYLTPTGIKLEYEAKKGRPETGRSIDFSTITSVQVKEAGVLLVDISDPPGTYLYLRIVYERFSNTDLAAHALERLARTAKAHHPFDCTAPPPDVQAEKAELAAFTQQTAAWRALTPKPPLSEEVEKKQLLAEDAFEQKDMDSAVSYYEDGVKLDPTWAQGWYNAAQLYAALHEYARAAFNMRHYLILLPNAPDVAEAKNDVLLWEAKADEAAGK